MVDVTEDQNTAEQVFERFREVADGKVSIPWSLVGASLILLQPYVTEMDLRHSLIPPELIDDLVKSMPAHRGPDLQEDRGVAKYDYVRFMERFVDDSEERANGRL